jgi:hypothetical protein
MKGSIKIFLKKLKKGAIDSDEIFKLILGVILLVVLIAGIIFLFKGKGGEIFASIKNVFHSGGNSLG